MHTRLTNNLWPLLLLQVACVEQQPEPKVEVVPHLWGQDLFLVEGDRRVDLTHFRPPRSIMDYAISSDGRHVFVRHYDRGPHQISVYDLGEGRRIGHWEPGYGGTMDWTPGGELIHTWGCGTQCASAILWSAVGERLEVHGADVFLLSDDHGLLASFSGYNEKGPRLELRDLGGHRSVVENVGHGIGSLEEWRFDEDVLSARIALLDEDVPWLVRLAAPSTR